MCDYLKTMFPGDDPRLLSAQDDFPLWSAPFGLMLLDFLPLIRGMNVLDVGFGSGFPLLELAQRLGNSSWVYGIDPLKSAHERTRYKMSVLQIVNVQLVEGDASSLPFQENSFDLVVSNLGVNNFDSAEKVFQECYRVAGSGGRIALTTNPKGHMDSFYAVFEETMKELRLEDCMPDLSAHIEHRLTSDRISEHLERSGFRIRRLHQDRFRLRFLDGSAFLRHALIKYGFLEDWKALVPDPVQKEFFLKLESHLNRISEKRGEFALTIPTAYIEGEK